MPSSKFIKSLNFGSNLKITATKNKNKHFSPRNGFLYRKNIFLFWNMVYSDRSELDLTDETIRIQISISVESYGKKNC